MRLEELTAGTTVGGLVSGETASVIALNWHGQDAASVTYRTADGRLGERLLYRSDEEALSVRADARRAFDADAAEFRLAAEANRIQLAGRYESMTAIATSTIDPLPHQIRAVYGPLLRGAPLRFLLADDPGAGKTIMAGLTIKELILRDDVHRCLVVAPGGLVDQWQDELKEKFDLRFEILTTAMAEASSGSVFDDHPLLIARMDQLVRNPTLSADLQTAEWDLVVVDEAHRMSAHYYGSEIRKTRRFELGELLGRRTRHLLLMTATPHAGNEDDFQLFLSLLDRDRFVGRRRGGSSRRDTDDVMLRRVKEDLLTFAGTPLFPERIAESVPYRLTDAEQHLYEQVTTYVREEMNRAARLESGRRNTIGFALTVLQRRLASSPEAIVRSLERRAARLGRLRQELLAGGVVAAPRAVGPEVYDDLDEYSADELERLEDDVVDAATAARSAVEVAAELAILADLLASARRVRDSGTDRKWAELRTILQDNAFGADGGRKIIVFTEHRDTLDYLTRRIGTLLGRPEAVVAIHGGVPRQLRRSITEEFSKNPECQVLVATDAAGEGLNLQAAHLMVNYDLPWNPNRIEQRFGRIHRIGQQQVCRLWNLIATDTREGEVFSRLLDKIEEQRQAYGGKVFDVLGEAMTETPLRTLLIDAIRYGEQPEVRQRMHEVIDKRVADGLRELLQERSLAQRSGDQVEDLERLRIQMAEAKSRRLQPHYIEAAFRAAFERMGGRLARRERGRFEISNVPAALRPLSARPPVATRYERVTFDLGLVDASVAGAGDAVRPTADLLAPGHPLHDAVTAEASRRWGATLLDGTVLVSGMLREPQLLVELRESVTDGTGTELAGRLVHLLVSRDLTVTEAGPAPYLDMVAAPESAVVTAARTWPWLPAAEDAATRWSVTRQLPLFVTEQRERRLAELTRVRGLVTTRLNHEINRLASESVVAAARKADGQSVRESAESLSRKADELTERLKLRLQLIDRQQQVGAIPPRVVAAAIVLPVDLVADDLPPDAPVRAVETEEVERRGVDAVLAAERALGHQPVEQARQNKGFDILSERDGLPIHIEVKGRIAGAEEFFISHTEALHALNMGADYRLALVRVDPRGAEFDAVRYVAEPFAGNEFGAGTDYAQHSLKWNKTWGRGRAPF